MDTHAGTTTHEPAPGTAAPPLPGVIWALAWSFVAGQVLTLLRHGVRDDPDWVVSSLLGVALVAFFASGVLRARLVRFWVVVVLLVVAAVVQLVTVVQEPDGWAVVLLILTASQLYLLNAYADSPWFRWHRRTPRGGPSIRRVLLVAVVVGILAGVIDTDARTAGVFLRFSF